MISLIIDTSTKYFYLSLVKDNTILKEILVEEKNHAPHSVLLIQEVLKENNLNTKDLDEVICGIGPGSYTGLRISLTIAKMICSFHNITLKTISTLYLMSSGYNHEVLSLIDARRGNYFSATYNGNNILEEKLRNIEDINCDYDRVYEDDFKVDVFKVIKNAVKQDKVDEVIPNYLRITEAEYNLKKNND